MGAAVSGFIFTFKAPRREKAHAKLFSFIIRAEAFSKLSENFILRYKYHLGVTWPMLLQDSMGKWVFQEERESGYWVGN